jgi:hypothetical protein
MIQWAKPVVQLASNTPDSLMDTGSPIFVFIPFFLWLGLSFFSSFVLWVRLKAQKEQKKALPWLIEKTRTILNRFMTLVLGFGKVGTEEHGRAPTPDGSYMGPPHHSRTVKLEDGLDKTVQGSHPASPPSGTGGEHLEVQRREMSGARGSGESTLRPGSATDGTEGIEMVPIKPAPPKTHEQTQ